MSSLLSNAAKLSAPGSARALVHCVASLTFFPSIIPGISNMTELALLGTVFEYCTREPFPLSIPVPPLVGCTMIKAFAEAVSRACQSGFCALDIWVSGAAA